MALKKCEAEVLNYHLVRFEFSLLDKEQNANLRTNTGAVIDEKRSSELEKIVGGMISEAS